MTRDFGKIKRVVVKLCRNKKIFAQNFRSNSESGGENFVETVRTICNNFSRNTCKTFGNF